MAGTTGYTRDTLDSVDMRDPREGLKQAKEMEDVSKNLQRFTTGGPVVGLDRFQQQQAGNQFLEAEQARRMAAAPGMFEIAGNIDTRLTAAGDTLAEASNKQMNRTDELYQQQAQALQEADFNKRKGLSDIDYKRQEIDWDAEKNQTRRDDALEDAYVKGIVDDTMLELAISNKMKLLDIDHYYRLKKNTLEQNMEDWKTTTDIDWQKMLAEMVASAEAFAMLFQGALGTVSAVTQHYGSKK
jgi:hypothetical protein